MPVNLDPTTTKYMIHARVRADGVIQKPDVVGAVFGQTEGLLGTDLDLRDLQKAARIGRVEVEIDDKKGKSEGMILIPSALDKVETAIIGAALETIDRVGPCKARIKVERIEDVRSSRRDKIQSRAKELLHMILEDEASDSAMLTDEVRTAVQVAEIQQWGKDKLWAGPGVQGSDDVILVEGRNDVVNLLRCGIRNALSVEGTSVPKTVIELAKERVTTLFIDGDRGGELIAREILAAAEIDFVARAPATREVEELPHKLVMKALNNKMPAQQFADSIGVQAKKGSGKKPAAKDAVKKETRAPAKRESPSRSRAGADRGRASDRETTDRPARGRGRGRASDRDKDADVDEDDGEDDAPRSAPRDRPRREPRRGPARRDEDDSDEPRAERTRERPPRREASSDRGGDRDGGRGGDRGGDRDGGRGGDRPAGRGGDRPARGGRDDRRGPAREKKPLSPELIAYRDILGGVSGSLKAVLLDKDGKELKAGVAVRELADTLKNSSDDVNAVVFDGVITQRLLDIATDRNIETIVGVKVGNVTKKPDSVHVVTKAELE